MAETNRIEYKQELTDGLEKEVIAFLNYQHQKMAKKIKPAEEGFNEILLYTTPNGKVKVEIYLQNETI